MADTIATAYVTIEPTFEGVSKKLEAGLGDESDKAGRSAGSKFGSGFASVLGAGTKIAAGAVAAGATAAAGITKSATESFAQFEQLAGGAELLFGTASDSVMKNAESAFQRVQMSTNDYLQSANSFATGLKESLGGDSQAAADLADAIIVAQADVVAATGNSAENVANAFAGIMKNNFTMLDNLQLGITPTKEGMQEVIDKMNELNGTKYEMGNLADMQSAIVDYIEYVGMAGYANKEASGTIEGSLATMKASWENLLTGLGDKNADLSTLIDNLVTSAETVANNMLPILEQALIGISTLVAEMAPVIAEKIPSLLESILPMLLTAGVKIAQTLGQGLMNSIPTLVPMLMQYAISLVQNLASFIQANGTQMTQSAATLIHDLISGFAASLPELISSATDIIVGLVTALTDPAAITQLVMAAGELIMGLANGLLEALPKLIDAIPQIISNLVAALVAAIPEILAVGIQLIIGLATGLIQAIPRLVAAIPAIILALVGGLKRGVEQIIEVGRDMVAGLWQGIKDRWNALVSDFKHLALDLVDGIKGIFGIGSPSKLFADEIGQWIPAGVAEGIEDGMGTIDKAMGNMATDMIVGANVTSSALSSAAASESVETNNNLYQLLSTYLPVIASGENMNLSLEGDASGLFNLVRRENKVYKRMNGESAFA